MSSLYDQLLTIWAYCIFAGGRLPKGGRRTLEEMLPTLDERESALVQRILTRNAEAAALEGAALARSIQLLTGVAL